MESRPSSSLKGAQEEINDVSERSEFTLKILFGLQTQIDALQTHRGSLQNQILALHARIDQIDTSLASKVVVERQTNPGSSLTRAAAHPVAAPYSGHLWVDYPGDIECSEAGASFRWPDIGSDLNLAPCLDLYPAPLPTALQQRVSPPINTVSKVTATSTAAGATMQD